MFLKLQEIKTLCLWHKSKPTFRGGFLFLSLREQWNESASQILEMTCRSWNSLTRMKCTAVHKDSFYFTICGAYHFKTALPSFQVRKANISFFPAISHKIRTFVTEITSNIYVHIFKEYKAKMAESIDHTLVWSKRAVQFVKTLPSCLLFAVFMV